MKVRIPSLLALLLTGLLAACGGELVDEQAALGTSTPAAAAVSTHGRLKVCGSKICNAAGSPVQLKGMSLFWSNTGWGAERFYNATAVSNLASGWGATVVRAAIGVDGGGGYMDSAQRAANVARTKAVIDGAIAAGIYVIVDWHSHELHQAEAQAFFGDLARTYATSPNVIWETFNEPTSQSWSSLKSYHTAVIATIRAAGSQNLVIAGSPTWSQDVDVAANDPIADTNTAYTLHFYAGSHGASLRAKADAAMARGKAVFVTEYGTCDASGNGGFNATESDTWAAWMDQRSISSANWALNDKAETASALLGGASATGPWTDANLTASGKWAKAYISKGSTPPPTTYALTVTKSGAGIGTVAASSGALSCGASCSATYASGATVTLTASAGSGSTFGGWSGACAGTAATCTVSMTAARSVSAAFNAGSSSGTTYVLTVTRSGTGAGTVTASGLSCGATCSASYASGATVTLTAAPAAGSTFAGWSGACTGTGACALSMTAARAVTATFTASTTGGGGTTPCANPITMTSGQSGNFNTTGAVCLRTSATVYGWGCSNFTGRTVKVNGTAVTCGQALPAKTSDGYYYFDVSPGSYTWASLYYW